MTAAGIRTREQLMAGSPPWREWWSEATLEERLAYQWPREIIGGSVSGFDLRGMDLSGCVFEDTVFKDADLRGAILSGTQLRNCYLEGADFRGALLDYDTIPSLDEPAYNRGQWDLSFEEFYKARSEPTHHYMNEDDHWVSEWRNARGQLSRNTWPARVVKDEKGTKLFEEHYKDGKLHRNDGPAVIDYTPTGRMKREQYFQDGELHRDGDKPAIIVYDSIGPHGQKGAIEMEGWYRDGKLHRDGDRPAQVNYHEDGFGKGVMKEIYARDGVYGRWWPSISDGSLQPNLRAPSVIYYSYDGETIAMEENWRDGHLHESTEYGRNAMRKYVRRYDSEGELHNHGDGFYGKEIYNSKGELAVAEIYEHGELIDTARLRSPDE